MTARENLNPQQFDQPFLPDASPEAYWKDGVMHDPGTLFPEMTYRHKQPHEMSPEEFASHPYAVFHSSHLDPKAVQQGVFTSEAIKSPTAPRVSSKFGRAVHMGTEQAAVENHKRSGMNQWLEDYTPTSHIHTFWHIPQEASTGGEIPVVSDTEANTAWHTTRGGFRGDDKTGNEYYENATEDKGSPSIAIRDDSRLRSQADFVRKAISEGRGHEVHPETMRRYNEGTLGFREATLDSTWDHIANRSNAIHRARQNFMGLHEEGLFDHPADGAGLNDEMYNTLERVGSAHRLGNGPDEERINNRIALDQREGGGYGRML